MQPLAYLLHISIMRTNEGILQQYEVVKQCRPESVRC